MTPKEKQVLADRINSIVYDSKTNLVKATSDWVSVSEDTEQITRRDIRRGDVRTRNIYKAEVKDGVLVGYTFFTNLILNDDTIVIEDKWIGMGSGEDLQEVLFDGRVDVEPVVDVATLQQTVTELQAELRKVKSAPIS